MTIEVIDWKVFLEKGSIQSFFHKKADSQFFPERIDLKFFQKKTDSSSFLQQNVNFGEKTQIFGK